MKAIINSFYIIEDIENFTLSLYSILLQFKSEEAKSKAIRRLSNLRLINSGLMDLQLDSNSGLTSISLFED